MGHFEEALGCYLQAVKLDANYFDALNNLGVTYKLQQHLHEALMYFDRALTIKKNDPSVLWNKSLALLLMGKLTEGFELFEVRWKEKHTELLNFPSNSILWLGQGGVVDKTVLLHSEQGLGDSIQFCRYAPLLKARGARVVMVVPKPLVALMQSLQGVDEVIESGQPLPAFDFHCPMMSLPLAFKTDLDTIPLSQGYLRADPIKSAAWARRLGPRQRMRVGVVWNGGFRANRPELWATNARRNVELAQFAQALQGLEVDFYSLQKGDPAESEIRGRELEFWPKGNFHNFVDELNDFSDTAALVDNLDLVVAVDTSTAHLAAAMGKPTWILNRFDTCWRWLLERSDSPWYDSVTLFRQNKQRDWSPALNQLSNALR
jgi:tetratricopeptide (TPR) repeat protein